jgi:hypothetical protein
MLMLLELDDKDTVLLDEKYQRLIKVLVMDLSD